MNRRVLGPLVVAVVAAVAAVLVLWWTFADPSAGPGSDSAPAPQRSTSPSAVVRTTERLTSRQGGFSVGVPQGLRGRVEDGTVYLSSRNRKLVVLVSRTEPGALAKVNRSLVRAMRANYRKLKVRGSRPERLAGRKGLSTYGSALTRRGVAFRFVQTTVRARPANVTVATFTAQDTDPSWVLPRANAALRSLKVRGRR